MVLFLRTPWRARVPLTLATLPGYIPVVTGIERIAEIDRRLHEPPPGVVEDLDTLDGDLVVLGAGGKMGLSLCRMAVEAAARGRRRRVLAVSRFSDEAQARAFTDAGIDIHRADLLDPAALRDVPDAPNVVYLVGRKFGTSGAPSETWALNTYLPGRVAERFRGSRIAALSTGNVYPLVPVHSGGADESVPPAPVGEYAQSCLGRERLLEHVSRTRGTPVSILRLNYAVEGRYGVLHDVATKVRAGEPIDLAMGCANVIWQGDANAVVLRSLLHAGSPPTILNLTGPELVSIRWLAHRFGERFGVEPRLVGEEAPTALLSNAAAMVRRFGYPSVGLEQMIEWTAAWLEDGGPVSGKPTHFQQREGSF
jgi:nucleoside-diphosphate-sugar epimerase